LQQGQLFLIQRAGRSYHDTFPGVDAQRVDVFHAGDREAVVVAVSDDFELDLFPAFERLFDQNLRSIGEGIFGQGFQFVHVIAESAAHTAQYIGRTDDNRETDDLSGFNGFFHGVDRDTARGFYADFIELFHKQVSVFGVHDGFDRGAQHFDTVFGQCAAGVEFRTAVQGRLAAEGQQNTVGTFFFDDLFDKVRGQREEIYFVGDPFRGLNGGDIGVNQYGRDTLFFHGFEGLRTGVIELSGLTDFKRTRTQD